MKTFSNQGIIVTNFADIGERDVELSQPVRGV